MPLSTKAHVHWMNLMKNQIIQKQKFQSLEILKEGENLFKVYHIG